MKKDDALLVEVFSGSPWECELIKGLLESNGIIAGLKDGILGTVAPYISPEVTVFVNEDDYEAATTIIKERDNKKKE